MECKHHFALGIDSFQSVFLSLAATEPVERKDPSSTTQSLTGRMPVESHILRLVEWRAQQGDSIDPTAPLLAISCRNVLANFRCGAWVKGQTKEFITVAEEDAGPAKRPYHILGLKGRNLAMEEFLPHQNPVTAFEWLFSGVPVWWDGEPVYPRMLTEAADPAHVFKLPRGRHPLATSKTVGAWRHLNAAFRSLIGATREHALSEMNRQTRGLEREDEYLHNIIGVTPHGQLRVLVANGRLESLGAEIAGFGAQRALMIDNGGSSSVFLYPDGFSKPCIQLVAGLNYRPPGTAFIVVVRPG